MASTRQGQQGTKQKSHKLNLVSLVAAVTALIMSSTVYLEGKQWVANAIVVGVLKMLSAPEVQVLVGTLGMWVCLALCFHGYMYLQS